VVLTFSDAKHHFLCPYSYKLRVVYGFKTPVARGLGYGKSLHAALAEVHDGVRRGRTPDPQEVPRLVDAHLHLPFANDRIVALMRQSGIAALTGYLRYLECHGTELGPVEHVEQGIEFELEDGLIVRGRIDLIRRIGSTHVAIVDFKCREDAQPHELTRQQLHIYAFGYWQLAGRLPDFLMSHNLDGGDVVSERVDAELVEGTATALVAVGEALRENRFLRLERWSDACAGCEVRGICRAAPHEAAAA
jgi:DNA helicase-2/ATP-dependent DNA helicase PcrA